MRGCGIPRGFWLKPGGSVDRVEGIIIETFVILCQYNSQIHRVPAGRIVTNKHNKPLHHAVIVYFLIDPDSDTTQGICPRYSNWNADT
jgi:hypothetical protein